MVYIYIYILKFDFILVEVNVRGLYNLIQCEQGFVLCLNPYLMQEGSPISFSLTKECS